MNHEGKTMHRIALLLTLLSALAPLAGVADDLPGSTAPSGREPRGAGDLTLRAAAGAFDGLGVRRASGPVALFQADWTPRLAAGDWQLAFPIGFEHRQTFGEHLDETVASAAVDARYVGASFETGPLGGFSYTWRPDWPDLYQPDGLGGTYGTDRYSHSRWFAGWQLWEKLGGGRHLRAKLRYSQETYVRDPNYDPTVSVVHLAPRDNHDLRLDASYRHLMHSFAWAIRLTAYDRKYDVLLAKVANTGGTRRSDPKQELRGFEPKAEVEFRSRPFGLTVGAGIPVQSDPFQGYYSYTGFRPFAEVKGSLTPDLSYAAKASAKLLTYGPDSKSITSDGAGAFIPGTDDGKRLWYRTYELQAGLRYALLNGFALVADASWARRDTNYRDYVPDVYPPTASRPYDIRWDYTNVMVTGGVEWSPPAEKSHRAKHDAAE